jgi:hypothetical protein
LEGELAEIYPFDEAEEAACCVLGFLVSRVLFLDCGLSSLKVRFPVTACVHTTWCREVGIATHIRHVTI